MQEINYLMITFLFIFNNNRNRVARLYLHALRIKIYSKQQQQKTKQNSTALIQRKERKKKHRNAQDFLPPIIKITIGFSRCTKVLSQKRTNVDNKYFSFTYSCLISFLFHSIYPFPNQILHIHYDFSSVLGCFYAAGSSEASFAGGSAENSLRGDAPSSSASPSSGAG